MEENGHEKPVPPEEVLSPNGEWDVAWVDRKLFYSSEKFDKVLSALINAQAKLQTVKKNADNPYFKTTYADFAAVVKEVRPHFAEFNLGFTQIVLGDRLSTVIFHTSGQWIGGYQTLKPDKGGLQGMGSAITYSKRYQLSPAVGCAVEGEDDDGEAATDHKTDLPLEEQTCSWGKHFGEKFKSISDQDLEGGLRYILDNKVSGRGAQKYQSDARSVLDQRKKRNQRPHKSTPKPTDPSCSPAQVKKIWASHKDCEMDTTQLYDMIYDQFGDDVCRERENEYGEVESSPSLQALTKNQASWVIETLEKMKNGKA